MRYDEATRAAAEARLEAGVKVDARTLARLDEAALHKVRRTLQAQTQGCISKRHTISLWYERGGILLGRGTG